MVRLISESDVDELLHISESIETLAAAHRDLADGTAATNFMETIDSAVQNPPADAVEPTRHELRTHSGVLERLGVGSVRINSDVVNWPDRGAGVVRDKIPAIDGSYTGFILLFDTDTGEPLAIIPDAIVQRTRTAGTSALCARELAIENPDQLGLLGAGWQARSHLPAYDHVFDLETVRVYALTKAEREDFVAEMDPQVTADLEAVDKPQQVFADADIVKCVTNASGEPVFQTDWIEPGTHVGLNRIEEAPDDFFATTTLDAFGTTFPRVVQHELYGQEYRRNEKRRKVWNSYVTETAWPVPRLDRALRMDSPHDWEDEIVSLGTLLTSDDVGRPDSTAITGFNTTSIGIDFTALAYRCYVAAREDNRGTVIPTELFTQEGHP
jgi:ornithine cyclodeaminase/alanine dehydrogenase-like protein (mu-crystallin family)